MVLPQLLPSIYTHIERSGVCKHESPSPTGGGLGWGYSRQPLCLYRNPVYIRLERSSVCKQESPSPAGRSPQRGRVGMGVGDIVGESKAHFSRLPPSPAISLASQEKDGRRLSQQLLPGFSSAIRRGRFGCRFRFGDDMDASTPTLPRCGLRPAGEGEIGRFAPLLFTTPEPNLACFKFIPL